jgi:hypothetical protein
MLRATRRDGRKGVAVTHNAEPLPAVPGFAVVLAS